MDLNIFFREATMRICSSLNLEKAMQSTLEYFGRYMPADSLLIGIINPHLGVSRIIAHIGPDDWPKRLGTVPLPQIIMARLVQEWKSEPKFGILNDPLQDEPDFAELHHLFWPDQVSLLHTDLALESKRIGILMLAARGTHRYREEHARMMNSLNEPFSIAMANALQYEEAVRLKEMLEDDNKYLHSELRSMSGDRIIGADFGLMQVMRMVRQVAPLESPVLLLGETGTGKELLANALHSASSRSSGPFIKVNCGGLPESLVDSELFGHEKGAFTGAISQNRGRFERAHNGTIFLDEIGELPLNVQTKLLRVLQHREIERVGGNKTVPVDVRIISATHQNLELMVGQGKFREDLWYRLNVFPIMIPPLRQRPQDIPALLDHLISRKCRDLKITSRVRLVPGTVQKLRSHHWPGNVRELENLVERTLIQARAASPGSEVLTINLDPGAKQDLRINPVHAADKSLVSFDEAASLHIRKALDLADGKITGQGGAAELLRLNPSTLRGKMRKLGISPLGRSNQGHV
ncbi:sigma-54 interaction domain-containing protein [Desulfonatronovibrio hydrogenovorans]|uniref:sigma-54 interaction domain-containing protein n=1 Tax=Desulfonatronovibrio hydrogenovorans TaxID=53245 RepID=UPI0005513D4F|nr:sigma 54-interacting transcriptional regulator [Desulfonatronovibrio hydrogenovorans]